MMTGKLRLRDDDYISDVYPKFFWADWYIHQTMFCVEPEKSGVIVGQKCIRLLGTALDDLFFKNLFYQKQCEYATNKPRGCSNHGCPFTVFYKEKVPFNVSAGYCFQFVPPALFPVLSLVLPVFRFLCKS